MRRSVLIASMVAACSSPAWAADPTGEWRVAKGYAHIRIANCNGALWGGVSWEQQPGGRDTQNPDPALRGRAILGSPILLNMKPNGDRWDGQIYNSENGKTYTANVRLSSPNTLQLQGCVLGGLLCGGEDWTRISASNPNAAQAKGARAGAPADVCSRVSNVSRRTH
jgi:uncharacterized protein (DUF2147 family)